MRLLKLQALWLKLRGTTDGRFCGFAVGFMPAEAGDPEAAVNIVDVDEAFVGERAPSEGKIGTKSSRVAGPEMRHFPALIVEFASQLARNIDDPPTAVVVADIHHVIDHPHVM